MTFRKLVRLIRTFLGHNGLDEQLNLSRVYQDEAYLHFQDTATKVKYKIRIERID